MTAKPLLFLCLGWLLASSFSAHAITREERTLFFGHDDRIYVDAKVQPWSMVIKWRTRTNTLCSGALVAPDIVVSAGHCLLTEKGLIDQGSWAYVGYKNGRYLNRRAIASAWVPPGFKKGLIYQKNGVYIDSSVAHLDVTFLRLAKPFPLTTGHFLLAPSERNAYLRLINALGWKATQSGYPGDQDARQLAHPNCRLTRLNPNQTLLHRCDTLEGDSGSPIFALVNGKPMLLAIQSSAPDAKMRHLADNIAVSVPAWLNLFLEWQKTH